MLRLIGVLIIFIQLAWAESEPNKLFVVENGKVQTIDFKNLKSVELETINYHPKFKELGKINYKGYLVKDILSRTKLNPEDAITIVGNTGQFSIELKAKELLAGNNIIATHVNGKIVDTEKNGLQIIYDETTLKKYPQLKQRSFWCWWVRSFITDSKFKPSLNVNRNEKTLRTVLLWPTPYGVSSITGPTSTKERNGVILSGFSKLRVELLNGNIKEIPIDGKSEFFLANPEGNKEGAYSLHQLIENNGSVQTFVNNLYYIKSIRRIQ